MPTIKNETITRAKEIITLQSDLILVETALQKTKHDIAIKYLNDAKQALNARTKDLLEGE